jgi:hypothetical protein
MTFFLFFDAKISSNLQAESRAVPISKAANSFFRGEFIISPEV